MKVTELRIPAAQALIAWNSDVQAVGVGYNDVRQKREYYWDRTHNLRTTPGGAVSSGRLEHEACVLADFHLLVHCYQMPSQLVHVAFSVIDEYLLYLKKTVGLTYPNIDHQKENGFRWIFNTAPEGELTKGCEVQHNSRHRPVQMIEDEQIMNE